MAKEQSKVIACRTCSHYMVTWDPSQPYGCRAHGFKGKKNPSLAVFEVSGVECQLYQPRQRIKGSGNRDQGTGIRGQADEK